ncbi:SPOR domain-containing protein [Glaciecola siphonariae]|uniref:SPOR domain-containing protein n=1 Tax=Glaciecola siphonariae TaxID=521012 RepID=A0ABV9LYQ7_9ALTE
MSQLHERLEHLVNYSSQLIFVSSDSLANQQRTLTDFLAKQHESTEVSFFTASADQEPSDYRRIICRQLADHTVGSFVRPLSELLSDLSPDKGHFLVCISQAQHIDMNFLNELWEWVTNSRVQNENIHINIILFAEQTWTENAQTWLPTHHTNKPVLLSSQSVDAVGFDVNALENLMAQKRAFFANDDAHSLVRKNWFIGAVMLVFLLIFATLISLQYPEHVKAFIAGETLPAAPDKSQTAPTSSENNELENSNTADNASLENADDTVSADTESAVFDSTDEVNASGYESQLELVEDKQGIADAMLVSNWPGEDAQELPLTPRVPASTAPQEQSTTANSAQSDAQDFAVPDIVSVDQLNTILSEQLNAPQAEGQQQGEGDNLSSPSQTSGAQVNNAPASNAAPANETAAQTPYPFDEAALLALPSNQVVLQLSGIQNRSVLDSYIGDNQLTQNTWIYQTQRYGGPWFVVLYRASFDSIEQATEVVASLPESVRNSGPFAKRVSQVQQEIRQP